MRSHFRATTLARMLAFAFLASAALAAPGPDPRVEVVHSGQYYHRPGHLVVAEPEDVGLEKAVENGYAPCPECAPPRLTGRALSTPPPSAYYTALLKDRAAGQLYEGVRARAGNPALFAPPASAPAAPAPPASGLAAAPAPAAKAPAFELPADGLPVPGTGGLLKVPTFKGSGGIIAIPYPMGGYGVVEPPFTTGPAAPRAGDPAPSGP